jgi:hypothetical protein
MRRIFTQRTQRTTEVHGEKRRKTLFLCSLLLCEKLTHTAQILRSNAVNRLTATHYTIRNTPPVYHSSDCPNVNRPTAVSPPIIPPMATSKSDASIQLTDQQQAVVDHNEGPALVFAVAGAGKTTAMVHRIERLVREHIFPAEQILATSFGRANVVDLKRTLAPWPYCRAVDIRTLHSLGLDILRRAQRHGYLTNLRLSNGLIRSSCSTSAWPKPVGARSPTSGSWTRWTARLSSTTSAFARAISGTPTCAGPITQAGPQAG